MQDSKTALFLLFSSPSEKDMLVSDQDIQVLYDTCASKECNKACSEVGFLWNSPCYLGEVSILIQRVSCCTNSCCCFCLSVCLFVYLYGPIVFRPFMSLELAMIVFSLT